MVDPSELVRIRPQSAYDFCDGVANGRLFWQCKSYDEYRLHCTIEGIEPLYTRSEFESMKIDFPSFRRHDCDAIYRV